MPHLITFSELTLAGGFRALNFAEGGLLLSEGWDVDPGGFLRVRDPYGSQGPLHFVGDPAQIFSFDVRWQTTSSAEVAQVYISIRNEAGPVFQQTLNVPAGNHTVQLNLPHVEGEVLTSIYVTGWWLHSDDIDLDTLVVDNIRTGHTLEATLPNIVAGPLTSGEMQFGWADDAEDSGLTLVSALATNLPGRFFGYVGYPQNLVDEISIRIDEESRVTFRLTSLDNPSVVRDVAFDFPTAGMYTLRLTLPDENAVSAYSIRVLHVSNIETDAEKLMSQMLDYLKDISVWSAETLVHLSQQAAVLGNINGPEAAARFKAISNKFLLADVAYDLTNWAATINNAPPADRPRVAFVESGAFIVNHLFDVLKLTWLAPVATALDQMFTPILALPENQTALRNVLGDVYDDVTGPGGGPLDSVAMLSQVLNALAPSSTLDVAWYLEEYADALAAVATGTSRSAYDHWLDVGVFQGYAIDANGTTYLPSQLNLQNAAISDARMGIFQLSLGQMSGDAQSVAERDLLIALQSERADLFADANLFALANRKAADVVHHSGFFLPSDIDRSGLQDWSSAGSFAEGAAELFGVSGPLTLVQLDADLGAVDAFQALMELPGFAELLQDPAILSVGIAEYGGVWTLVFGQSNTGPASVISLGTPTLYRFGGEADNDFTAGTWAGHLLGGAGADTLRGGAFGDMLYGDAGLDTLTGGAGNDFMNGGEGADTMIGGDGDDTYVVDDAGDVTTEAPSGGADTVQSSRTLTLGANLENLVLTGESAINGAGNALNNVMTGNGAANTLNGLSGADTLSGAGGDDILDGGAGGDAMSGGAGNDTYFVDNASDTVTENAAEGTDTIRSGVGVAALAANVENLVLLGAAATANGNALNNTITGNAANNSINGLAGADTMAGGLGNDTYFVDDLADIVTEAASQGTDIIFSTVNVTALAANVENLTISGAALNATGNALNNTIAGNSQNNTLNGGSGEDTLVGGIGNDLYVVNSGGDIVTEALGAGTDSILALINITALAANVENVTLAGTATSATGNELSNILTGNGLNNTLVGGLGNDQLNGGVGADTMSGGGGDDAYLVENAGDVTIEAAGEGAADIVYAFVSLAALGANIERVTITGVGNLNATGNVLGNRINGNTNNNVLTGLDGADVIQGLAGADTINGGAGLDIMTGGADADTFVFAAIADSGATGATRDVINDFTQGTDLINLTAIDAITGGGDNAFTFIGAAAFSNTAGQLRYDQIDNSSGTDYTILSLDVNGDGVADSQITLVGLVTLTVSDFGL